MDNKFRAWAGGVMVYFDLFDIAEGISQVDFTKAFRLKNSMVVSKKCPIMYSAQRKDKNGKDIYQGDILRDDAGDLFQVMFGQLPTDKSGDCVCHYDAFWCKGYGHLGYAPNYECTEIGDWMEIIGNIHQNPEILGGKAK